MKFLSTTLVFCLSMVSIATAQDTNALALVIGLVGKSQSNPAYQAACKGAKDAARDLGATHGLQIRIDCQTPEHDDPRQQSETIARLAREGARGIAVACSDATSCTPAINQAVDLGTVVCCFESDAPDSKRLSYYGMDDLACGQLLMTELAKLLSNRGNIAILAGPKSSTQFQMRVSGIREELRHRSRIAVIPGGIFNNSDSTEQAAQLVNTAQRTDPDIDGWAMVGAWPLLSTNFLNWTRGSVKVVVVDALPAQLAHLRSSHVAMLLAQDYYGWGYKSVEALVGKIVKCESPSTTRTIDPLTPVTRENVDEWAKKWIEWTANERN